MSGKMTEEDYIKELESNKWIVHPEDPLLYSKYLLKFRNVGNRRNALIHSVPIKKEALQKLLMSGSSLVTALRRPTLRQIRPLSISMFSIIYRVPFSWSMREYPEEFWNHSNFDYLENCLLSGQELVEKLVPQKNVLWSINGYQLKIKGVHTLYLRLEKRSGLVILDLMNPSSDNLDILIGLISKVNCTWKFKQMPSVVIGHSFYVFFGAMKNEAIDKLIEAEYPLLSNLHNLSAIYGGK